MPQHHASPRTTAHERHGVPPCAAVTFAIGVSLVLTSCSPVDDTPLDAAGSADAATAAAEATATYAPGSDADLAAFTASLPESEVRDLDLETALTLAAMPLSCLDRPHAAPRDRRAYLDTIVASRVPGYEETRAFYGCWDWHSAVNSTWAMVRIYAEFPEIGVGGLIEEKLNDHLSERALEGETAFFEESRTFERPYGWAWLLALYAELRAWDHPDAATWADRVAPLATLFSERMVEHLGDLKIPSRVGVHANTAFSLAMMLDAARSADDATLAAAVEEAALRFYADDVDCPTAYEPWGSDFLSPCLEEAALMAAVLDTDSFIAWLDGFLPPLFSPAFAPLTRPTNPEDVVAEVEGGGDGGRGAGPAAAASAAEASVASDTDDAAPPDAEDEEERRAAAELRALASASHLIGLAFIRADAMNRIAAALPADDARVPALRRIARLHGARGFEAMFEADYAGSHWIGTFALKYLLTEQDGEDGRD